MADARETSLAGGEESDVTTKTVVPGSEHPLVIRTDFSDQATWEAILKAMRRTTSERFGANVELLDDPAFQGLTSTQVLGLVSEEYQHSFLMIVDHATITEPEHPLAVVNLYKGEDWDEPEAVQDGDESVKEPEYGRQFRAIPAAIQAIENNLSIANMNSTILLTKSTKTGFSGIGNSELPSL